MPNIQDVAKEAGLSVTTVSRVFNNRGYISDETKIKVQQACDLLGYRRNDLARALFHKKSNIIGVIMPHISNYFFAELCQAIETNLFEKGFKMMLCTTLGEPAKEKAYLELLASQQVDGVIIGSHSLEADDYAKIDIPLVAFDRYLSENIPCIGVDHFMGGEMAAEHLIKSGCKHLAHLKMSKYFNSPVHMRTLAFEKMCKKNNIPYVTVEKELNEFKQDPMALAYNEIVSQMPEVDGFFVNDTEAASLLQILHQCGKKVPEQVQIVGYDGTGLSKLLIPRLSTIAQPLDQVGKSLVESLIQVIEGHTIEKRRVISVAFVEGETTRRKVVK